MKGCCPESPEQLVRGGTHSSERAVSIEGDPAQLLLFTYGRRAVPLRSEVLPG